MESKESPAASITDGLKTISYASNSEGRIELVKTEGWQPVNEVNAQAWQEIDKQVDRARHIVRSGRASSLYYHMIAKQMNIFLLARYCRQSLWRTALHLMPFFFQRLSQQQLQRYADLLQISVTDLIQGSLPPAPDHSRRQHD